MAATTAGSMWNPTGGLGDIMGRSGASSLDEDATLRHFSPLQRVVLLANGNLQRLVSSFYDAPVTVNTRFNKRIEAGLYEREVELVVLETVFARCTSTVRLTRSDCISAIEDEGVAIGQLFRHLNILPGFELKAAGVIDGAVSGGVVGGDGSMEAAPATDAVDAFAAVERRFWRDYVLSGEGVECHIREELRSDLFELRPLQHDAAPAAAAATTAAANKATPSLGDIMAPATTFTRLPPGFTPHQRLLLTANGNVERLLSSFYCKPAHVFVVLNQRRGAVYDRQVALMLDGRQLMLAKSTCFLNDPEWSRVAEAEQLPIGALFRRFNVLPTFTLHAAGHVPGGFWRQYQLEAAGKLVCQINETFDAACFQMDEHGGVAGANIAGGSHCDEWGSVG